jgi:hypothetical protein
MTIGIESGDEGQCSLWQADEGLVFPESSRAQRPSVESKQSIGGPAVFPSLYTLDQSDLPPIQLPCVDHKRLAPSVSAPTSHSVEINALRSSYEYFFPTWVHQLRIGFHLLFSGYGGKRALMQSFLSKLHHEYQILVIDGSHSELSLDIVMNKLLVQYVQPYLKQAQQFYSKKKSAMIRKNTDKMTLLTERISQIIQFSKDSQKRHGFHSHQNSFPKPLLVAIFHMDGEWIRSDKFQLFLSLLCKPESHCRIIACVDNISSPLLMSSCRFPRWKWLCHDVTTFQPYTKEELALIREQLQGTVGSNIQQYTSTLTVLANLTPNARSIYVLLAKVQLFFASMDEPPEDEESDFDLNVPSSPLSQKSQTPGSNNSKTTKMRNSNGSKRNLLSMITCTTPLIGPSNSSLPSLKQSAIPSSPAFSTLNIDSVTSSKPQRQRALTSAPTDYSTYGLTFSQFYQLAMENFLTGNEISFRTQLSEFFDHKLLVNKKLSDGTEVMYLPFTPNHLRDVLHGLESLS